MFPNLNNTGNMNQKYYDILDLTPGCCQDDIRKAYKKLALKYHPDKNKEDGAQDKFKAIAEAYEILTHKAAAPRPQPQPRPQAAPRRTHVFMRSQPKNPFDLFKELFGEDVRTQHVFQNMHHVRPQTPNTTPPTHLFNGAQKNLVSAKCQHQIRVANGKKIETVIEKSNGQEKRILIETDLRTGQRRIQQFVRAVQS